MENPEEQDIIIERNTHVKVEISEGRGPSAMKAVENYRVLAIYTKSYNKWFLCDHGKQPWEKNMEKGKYRVLLRMMVFDHLMGKYKDCDPSSGFSKWKKKSVFVLCDASLILDVVQNLSTMSG